jgi:hypothetical protein
VVRDPIRAIEYKSPFVGDPEVIQMGTDRISTEKPASLGTNICVRVATVPYSQAKNIGKNPKKSPELEFPPGAFSRECFDF